MDAVIDLQELCHSFDANRAAFRQDRTGKALQRGTATDFEPADERGQLARPGASEREAVARGGLARGIAGTAKRGEGASRTARLQGARGRGRGRGSFGDAASLAGDGGAAAGGPDQSRRRAVWRPAAPGQASETAGHGRICPRPQGARFRAGRRACRRLARGLAHRGHHRQRGGDEDPGAGSTTVAAETLAVGRIQKHPQLRSTTYARGYVDMEPILSLASKEFPPAKILVEQMGVTGLKRFTFHLGYEGPHQQRSTLEFVMPRAAEGALGIFGQLHPVIVEAMPPIPPDASYVSTFGVNPEQANNYHSLVSSPLNLLFL